MAGSGVKGKDSPLKAGPQIVMEPDLQGRAFEPRRKAFNSFDEFAKREAGDEKFLLLLK